MGVCKGIGRDGMFRVIVLKEMVVTSNDFGWHVAQRLIIITYIAPRIFQKRAYNVIKRNS